MSKYATGKHSKAISDRSGMEFPYREMVREWNGSFVHYTEFEPKQPQLQPKGIGGDGIALLQVRPDRTEPATTVRIVDNGFETYAAGSGIINVFSPGHGLTDSTTYRFRGPPTTSAGSAFTYANPESFDGISGSNIAKAAGYSITTGLYVSDARVSTDYAVANFFFFTVDTDTATKGGVSGGGLGCSVGPVTLSA